MVQDAAINPISTKEQEEKSFKPGNKDREGEDWWNKPLDNPFHLVINKPFGSNGQPAVHRESHRNGPNRQEQGDLFQAGSEGSEEKRMDWVDGQKIPHSPVRNEAQGTHAARKKERSGGYLLSHG